LISSLKYKVNVNIPRSEKTTIIAIDASISLAKVMYALNEGPLALAEL